VIFTNSMVVAVRVMNHLAHSGGRDLWMREPVLRRLHGIHRNTLRALEVRGILERSVARRGDYAGRWQCRFTPLANAIIVAVRA
jgi:hypothetical protein